MKFLHKLLNESRKAYYASELSKSTIEMIKQVEMDPRHDHLNSLLEMQPVQTTPNVSAVPSPQPAQAPQQSMQQQPLTANPKAQWQNQQKMQRVKQQPISQLDLHNYQQQLSRLPQYMLIRLLKNLNALKPSK